MGRSAHRRATTGRIGSRGRRAVIAAATLTAFGVLIGVSQISNAETDRDATAQTNTNGLDVLGDSCEDSALPAHAGFQEGGRCVSTAFGEVAEAEKNPTLLITEFPENVGVGEPFQLKVSTRNLVRDRFLPAAQGGYYVESSLLNGDGLVRGHFHTACRMLTSTTEAVDPAPVPAFFVATEDGGGGAEPDVVTILVPGMPQEGVAQCASWAGDGSHRIPMMQRANQTPALDAVRIRVGAAGQPPEEEAPEEEQPEEQLPGEEQPEEQPEEEVPGEEQPGEEQPGEEPQPQEPGEEEGPGEQEPGPETPEETASPEPPATPVPTEAPTEAPEEAPTSPPAAGVDPEDDEQTAAPVAGGTDPTPSPSPTAPAPEESTNDPGESPAPIVENQPAGAVANAPAADELAADSDDLGGDRLALTGANTMNFLVVGAVLILGGLVIVHLTQRRRYPGRRR
ncbi:hypothetical protein [Solwaraspora sp. WMMD406]|uniref:hypothetical protein n=1 Tax=Solwaraspora sp. WMMD406 TaxID=3016095 RepID=UPI003242A27F